MTDSVKSLRLILGLIASVVWLTFWYFHFDHQRTAALNKIVSCPLVKEQTAPDTSLVGRTKEYAKKGWEAVFGEECENRVKRETKEANAIVSEGMTAPIFACAIIFVVSHYAAVFLVNFAQQREENARLQVAAHSFNQSQVAFGKTELARQRKAARSDVIKRVGVIEEYFTHLADPSYQHKVRLIRQNISSAFVDLIAAHPLSDLKAIIEEYDEVRTKLAGCSSMLRRHGINDENLSIILSDRTLNNSSDS